MSEEVKTRGIPTIGLEIFILVTDEKNPSQKKIVKVEHPRVMDPGTDTVTQIDTTCYGDEFEVTQDGITQLGEGSLTVLASRKNPSHVLLFDMSKGRTLDKKNNVKWAVGYGDGKAKPVLNSAKDDWELPTTQRTFVTFSARVTAFPLSSDRNAVLETPLTLKRASGSEWIGGEMQYPKNYTLEVTSAVGFLLKIGEQETDILASNADDSAIRVALEGLSMASSVTVSEDSGVFSITLEDAESYLTASGATVEEV